MAYYPPPNQAPDYSISYHPNSGQVGFNPPGPYGGEPPGPYTQPAPFPTDYGAQGPYIPPGQYPPPGGYPPPNQGQYPPPNQGYYPPPDQGQYPPPGQSYGQGYGQVGGPPIMNQPGPGGDWMAMPPPQANCPPGLEYFIPLSNLFVKQKVEFLEALTGFESQNKFTIKNDKGEKLFWAMEDSDAISRQCCGRLRPFEMSIMDAQKNEIIHLNRPIKCTACCFPCCLQKIEVFSPPGNLIGTVEQEWSIFYPQFKVKDGGGATVLRIQGPFCAMTLCGQAEFQILSRDKQIQVGKISREWSGFARELFTDADYFGISFPADLDVRMKAVMLGALFLIDAIYFEN